MKWWSFISPSEVAMKRFMAEWEVAGVKHRIFSPVFRSEVEKAQAEAWLRQKVRRQYDFQHGEDYVERIIDAELPISSQHCSSDTGDAE